MDVSRPWPGKQPRRLLLSGTGLRVTYGPMSRRVLAWFLAVPLVAAGVESGHWLAYRVVYPDAYLRAQALSSSGHDYLSYAPLVFAIAVAVAVCVFGLRVVARPVPESPAAQMPLLPFLLVSPFAFALQECIERVFVGSWPFSAVLAPTFMPGLVFQLPFAVLAFLLARWLLRAADRLRALVFGAPRAPVSLSLQAVVSRLVRLDLPRLAPLAGCHGERGPPPTLVPAPVFCR
jgi:hypothetical protein